MGKKQPKSEKKKDKIFVSKVSVKTVFGKIDVKQLAAKSDKAFPIMRIIGIAKKVLTGSSQFGDWIGFAGDFEAVNLVTGEIFHGGKCFLPAPVTNMLAGQFSEKIDTVRFGFVISAKYSDAANTKYEYISNSLIAPAEDNPLSQLKKELEK